MGTCNKLFNKSCNLNGPSFRWRTLSQWCPPVFCWGELHIGLQRCRDTAGRPLSEVMHDIDGYVRVPVGNVLLFHSLGLLLESK